MFSIIIISLTTPPSSHTHTHIQVSVNIILFAPPSYVKYNRHWPVIIVVCVARSRTGSEYTLVFGYMVFFFFFTLPVIYQSTRASRQMLLSDIGSFCFASEDRRFCRHRRQRSVNRSAVTSSDAVAGDRSHGFGRTHPSLPAAAAVPKIPYQAPQAVKRCYLFFFFLQPPLSVVQLVMYTIEG